MAGNIVTGIVAAGIVGFVIVAGLKIFRGKWLAPGANPIDPSWRNRLPPR